MKLSRERDRERIQSTAALGCATASSKLNFLLLNGSRRKTTGESALMELTEAHEVVTVLWADSSVVWADPTKRRRRLKLAVADDNEPRRQATRRRVISYSN